MTQQSPGPSRLARIAAKEVPHRKSDRFFAAKSNAKAACEQLALDVRRSQLREATQAEILRAVERVQQSLHDITLDTADARAQVVDIDKEIQHLQLAEKWVAASERVQLRLGTNGSTALRDSVMEAEETVMWCVRAEHWNGKLTSSLALLEKVVREAEAQAARTA